MQWLHEGISPLLEFRTKKLLSLICLVIVTKIISPSLSQAISQNTGNAVFWPQRTGAEQEANNLGDQLNSAKENYAHSQAELGQVKAEKDGVFAALECNKRELHRKEQQLNQLKVELSGEKKLRVAAEQKAEILDDKLKRAQENLNLYETELVEVSTERYGRAAA